MQIKKSELRSIIKEQVGAFFVTPQPFGSVSRNANLEDSLKKFDNKEVDEKELNNVIKQTMSELEEEAIKRMRSTKLKEAKLNGTAKGRTACAKEVEQHWMSQFESILKKKAPKLVGQVEQDRAQYMQTMGYTPEDAVKDIINPNTVEKNNYDEIQKSKCAEAQLSEAKKKPAKWHKAIKRPVKVGDKVHVGHAQKGGAGVEGEVTKIVGKTVYITNDMGKTYKGPLKNTAIREISGVDSLKPNDPHTPGASDVEKDAADDVMEAGPEKKGGRPRGAPHIENVKFWDMSEVQLRYIIKDAGKAVQLNPTARKAGKWADEINDAVTVLYFRKKKGIKVEELEEAWKLGGLGPKILNNPSTIKMVNPKNPREIFVIFSRLKKGGGKQDKISMAVVDKTGRALKDWGSHVNVKGALKFAQSKGYTKKVDESFNTAPAGQGKEHASVIGANESPEMGSLASSPKAKAIIKKMHDLVTKQLKFKTVEDIQPIQGGVAFIFGDKAEASKMASYLKKKGALGKVLPLAGGPGKRTMVSLRMK